MSDRLRQSLMSSRSEIVAGLAEAEAELARVRQRAAELEELIALGTATLLAAEMISGGGKGSPEPAAEEPAVDERAAQEAAVGERAAQVTASEREPSAPEPSAAAEADPSAEPEIGRPDEMAPEPAQGATYEDDLRALLERAQS